VQDVLLGVANVAEARVYGKPNPLVGEIVCAAVRMADREDEQRFIRRVRLACRERLEHHMVPVVIELAPPPGGETIPEASGG
jgi:acyl-coenzyme A synthetase/AMP-(fatty) acid ligase